MSVKAKQHQAINFTQGAPDFATPEWLIDRVNHYMQKGFNQYSPIPGTLPLKQALAHKISLAYGVEIANPEQQISITAGAIEAIFGLISAYIGQGDEVIYFDPAFDAYPNIVAFNQGISRRLKLCDNGDIDLEAIASAINSKTKLIILNSPHNPMGSVITREQYLAIADMIKGKDILLLSDEVYEHIYASEHFTSALSIEALRDQLVVVQSLGKTYNLTGWRLGACIAPPKIITAINAVKQFTSFSAVHPMQLALADGIEAHPEYWQDLPKLYQKQHQRVVAGLANSCFKIRPWQGSPFLMLDYSAISNEDDLTFCDRLIEDYGVGLVPISSLSAEPTKHLVRLCFAKYDDAIDEGVKRLCQI